MKIIIISKDGDALDLAIRLKREGHQVKIAIQEKDFSKVGSGFGLVKVRSWQNELSWVGKEGLIIFDQTGWGKEQDALRKQGYSVVGGSEGCDRLEFDRKHAQEIFKKHGMKTVRCRHVCSADEAIRFVHRNKGRLVVKQNGHTDKCFAYVGRMPDGGDVIGLLENYKKFNRRECASIDLQERVEGVELAATRYFNGQEWVGPIMMNIEHKKLFPAGLGPMTSEMGTLMWFDDDDNNKLFTETLARIKPYLAAINFRGCFDINCIVNEKGAVPLEATPRFGYPTIHVEATLTLSPWGEFLKAVADGQDYDLKWRKGFGIVVLVAVPPFPYEAVNRKYRPDGLRISFKDNPTDEEWIRIHFCEVAKIKSEYIIAAKNGYALCVSGFGKTVAIARQSVYSLVEKICVPRMFYRHDIGLKFIERDRALLKKWGYL
jgi:phosphoribosylamine--glycine ligase